MGDIGHYFRDAMAYESGTCRREIAARPSALVREGSKDHNSGCECPGCEERSEMLREKRLEAVRQQAEEQHARDHAVKENRLIAGYLTALDRAHPSYEASYMNAPSGSLLSRWQQERAAYVKGDDSALERMRSYVTPDNPPLAELPDAEPVALVTLLDRMRHVAVLTGVSVVLALAVFASVFMALYIVNTWPV